MSVIARIPTAENVSGPASLRPSGAITVADTSGLTEGIAALGQGVRQLGSGLQQRQTIIDNRQRVADVAKADAEWLKGSYDLGNSFEKDGDYSTFETRAMDGSGALKERAAALITDPETRQLWMDQAELKRISLVEAIKENGDLKLQQANRVGFENAIRERADLIADPNIPEAVREQARQENAAAIQLGQSSGLVTPEEAGNLRSANVEGADERLAINRAEQGILNNPEQVLKDLAINGGTIGADFKDLTYEQRLTLAAKARSALDQRNVGVRSSLATIEQNAPAAISATGTYDYRLPTVEDYTAAYGDQEGPARYAEFQTSVDVAHSTFNMRTMSADEIVDQVAAAVPTSSGNDAALEQKAYEVLNSAATNILDARAKDPAGYTLSVFDNVRAAFEAADAAQTPEEKASLTAVALNGMAEAQKSLGMNELTLLPTSAVENVKNIVADTQIPSEQRVAVLVGTVMQTSDPEQQAAILNQLIAGGVPEGSRALMDAIARGDGTGAQMIGRALLIEPDKLAIDVGETDATIRERATDQAFGVGTVGDVLYGLTDGTADNLTRFQADAAMFDKMVKLRMIDGSAGGNINTAIAMTQKDMWGDLKRLNDRNAQAVLPADVDQNVAATGFRYYLPQVRAALYEQMMGEAAGMPTADGSMAIAKMGVDTYVDEVMPQSYFTNAGVDKNGVQTFVFINDRMGTAVVGADGKPLTFALTDIMSAGTMVMSEPIDTGVPVY